MNPNVPECYAACEVEIQYSVQPREIRLANRRIWLTVRGNAEASHLRRWTVKKGKTKVVIFPSKVGIASWPVGSRIAVAFLDRAFPASWRETFPPAFYTRQIRSSQLGKGGLPRCMGRGRRLLSKETSPEATFEESEVGLEQADAVGAPS